MVVKDAWVSNFVKDGMPSFPDDMVSEKWRIRDALAGGSTAYLAPQDRERIEGLINFLYRERHMSPFEHGSFTFVVDTPIFVAREFMRHRTFSYNETSGRYKELEPRFYLIDSDRPVVQKGKVGAYRFDGGTDEQYGHVFASTSLAYSNAWSAYQNMLGLGVAREVARNVLPVGIMTQFYATANPRNIMQFLLLRNDDNALAEIRDVAEQIEQQFAKAMPLTYAAYKKYDWREEKVELTRLRAQVAQMEAYETYADNINASPALLGLTGNGRNGKVRGRRGVMR
jgi:thymidylate synthase (FAD)